MTRTYDTDRQPTDGDRAVTIASRRTARLDTPFERHKFMAAFQLGRQFALRGKDSHAEYRRMLEADDSVGVAGLIEGESSVRKPGSQTLEEVMPYERSAYAAWDEPVRNKEPRKKSLSKSELQALLDAACGYSAYVTAKTLGITPNAANQALHRARKKLNATSTAQAVVLAIGDGQLDMRIIRKGMAS